LDTGEWCSIDRIESIGKPVRFEWSANVHVGDEHADVCSNGDSDEDPDRDQPRTRHSVFDHATIEEKYRKLNAKRTPQEGQLGKITSLQ